MLLQWCYKIWNKGDVSDGGGGGDGYYDHKKMHMQTNKEANKKKESEEEGTRTTATKTMLPVTDNNKMNKEANKKKESEEGTRTTVSKTVLAVTNGSFSTTYFQWLWRRQKWQQHMSGYNKNKCKMGYYTNMCHQSWNQRQSQIVDLHDVIDW